jgi:3-keto-disaccharide hydrolase
VLIADWRFTRKPEMKKAQIILSDGGDRLNDDGTRKLVEVPDAGDSGIYLRGSAKAEVNIWAWPIGSGELWNYRTDTNQPPAVRAGATPKLKADAPLGQWNRFIITMRGERLTVVLNGKTVIESARLPDVPQRGPIGLQHHGDPIEFANLLIKELD